MGDMAWKSWERKCAVLYSRWLAQGSTGVESERIICRQALTGRMVEQIYGDLAIHPKCAERFLPMAKWFMGHFQTDAKNRKAFRLPGLLTAPSHPFWSWWDKLTEETPKYSRILTRTPRPGDPSANTIGVEEKGKVRMMVIMNAPSKEHLLVLGFGDLEFVESAMGKMDRAIPTFEIRHVGTEDAVKIVVLEDFLKWADPVSLGCPKLEGDGNVPEAAGEVGK